MVLGDAVVAVGNRSAALARERPLFGLADRERWQLPEEVSGVVSPAAGAGGLFVVDPFPSERLVAYR
jgi:hypothetical protein